MEDTTEQRDRQPVRVVAGASTSGDVGVPAQPPVSESAAGSRKARSSTSSVRTCRGLGRSRMHRALRVLASRENDRPCRTRTTVEAAAIAITFISVKPSWFDADLARQEIQCSQ